MKKIDSLILVYIFNSNSPQTSCSSSSQQRHLQPIPFFFFLNILKRNKFSPRQWINTHSHRQWINTQLTQTTHTDTRTGHATLFFLNYNYNVWLKKKQEQREQLYVPNDKIKKYNILNFHTIQNNGFFLLPEQNTQQYQELIS